MRSETPNEGPRYWVDIRYRDYHMPKDQIQRRAILLDIFYKYSKLLIFTDQLRSSIHDLIPEDLWNSTFSPELTRQIFQDEDKLVAGSVWENMRLTMANFENYPEIPSTYDQLFVAFGDEKREERRDWWASLVIEQNAQSDSRLLHVFDIFRGQLDFKVCFSVLFSNYVPQCLRHSSISNLLKMQLDADSYLSGTFGQGWTISSADCHQICCARRPRILQGSV